jgi:hypothetical protein
MMPTNAPLSWGCKKQSRSARLTRRLAPLSRHRLVTSMTEMVQLSVLLLALLHLLGGAGASEECSSDWSSSGEEENSQGSIAHALAGVLGGFAAAA